MSDKSKDDDAGGEMPERFLEAPLLLIGDEVVYDPEDPKKHKEKLDRLLKEALDKAKNEEAEE